ncbi:MAG: hypothetical protein WBP81_19960 [Solirubrobacteraceae bacterium]
MVYAHGAALTAALLYDDESALYIGAEAGSAWYWAELATQALEGRI